MVKGLYIMESESFHKVYPSDIRREIEKSVDIISTPLTKEMVYQDLSILHNIDVIFSGWGGPKLDKSFLKAAPHLNAFFYAAGSLKGIVTDFFWGRGITITSAYAANAIPVAEYALSQILFSLKYGWHYALAMKRRENYQEKYLDSIPGTFGATVGIISLGMTGRCLCESLKQFDVNVLAYDPYVSKDGAEELDVESCSLEDIFRESDVVSVHAPWLKETEGMISGYHIESMKPYASIINTARGAVVNESELIHVLKHRQDLMAILDVTNPEPPVQGSNLYKLPNVVLTPHIAGSQGAECGRMGSYMLQEFKRYLGGKRLHWQINQRDFETLA